MTAAEQAQDTYTVANMLAAVNCVMARAPPAVDRQTARVCIQGLSWTHPSLDISWSLG